MKLFETKEITTTKSVVTNMKCDHCGRVGHDYKDTEPFDPEKHYSYGTYPLVFRWNEGEEAEILMEIDLCGDCEDEFIDEFCDFAKKVREYAPTGSFRASTMLDWEGTGIFDPEGDF